MVDSDQMVLPRTIVIRGEKNSLALTKLGFLIKSKARKDIAIFYESQ